jgi:YVTN family beta-propeller protein
MSRIRYPLLLLACACSAVQAAPFAYVPNEKSATVTVIDTATGAAVRQIAAGQRPRGIAADPAGTRLYVTDAAANALLVLDAASGALLATIPLGRSPEGVNASRDGRWIAVAVEDTNSVALVDAVAGKLVADMPVEGKNPEHAVFSPDGRWLLVSAENAEQVDVIDVAARRQWARSSSACARAASAFRPTAQGRMSRAKWRARCTCWTSNGAAASRRSPRGRTRPALSSRPMGRPCTCRMARTAA